MSTTQKIIPKAIIIKVIDLLQKEYVIPSFQRPYKWTVKNVDDLINDLITFQNKEAYRIGTIIIYDDVVDKNLKPHESSKEVVDGQQRFLTILLIINALKINNDSTNLLDFEVPGLGLTFENDISRNNLKQNYDHIVSRIKDFDDALIRFFLNKCELVQVTIYDLGEAFQFFDSQNSRGKSLYPHNLLKAFHLREMNHLSQEEKITLIQHWDATSPSLLSDSFANYFYRIKQWSAGRGARYFGKDQLYVFKGININASQQYPYSRTIAINAKYVQIKKDILFDYDHHQEHFPHQIDNHTVNGEWFFDFVKHKIKSVEAVIDFKNQIYTSLPKDSLASSIIHKLENYSKGYRTGDRYCRKLFEATLLYFTDKFGTDELEKVIPIIFFWSYRPRIKYYAVRLESIDNHAKHENGLIRKIKEGLHISDILIYKTKYLNKAESNSLELAELFQDYNLIKETS